VLPWLLREREVLRYVAGAAAPLAGPHRKRLSAALDDLAAFDREHGTGGG